jgi:hypothetical protein
VGISHGFVAFSVGHCFSILSGRESVRVARTSNPNGEIELHSERWAWVLEFSAEDHLVADI